jgi:hypothetical protein
MAAMVHHSLGTESLKTGRFHHDSGFDSLMADMIHYSAGGGSLVVTTVHHIHDHGSLIAGNMGFPYSELPQAFVAAWKGTLGILKWYIADRGFS